MPTLTEFRKTLADQIDHVRSGGKPVIIWRFGKPAAVLVSLEHYEMILEAEETVTEGPRDPKTGRRIGVSKWRAIREKFGLARADFEREVEIEGKRAQRGSYLAHRLRDEVKPGDWSRDGRLRDLDPDPRGEY